MDYVTIIDEIRIPLETARKDMDFGTKTTYNPDRADHFSEWAVAAAMSQYKNGSVVPDVDFKREIARWKVEQHKEFEPIVIDRNRWLLADARKDADYGSGIPYDQDNQDHISEWTMAMTLASYKQGQLVPFDEFYRMTVSFKRQQMLIDMEERGLMESYWDGTGVAYRVTEKGMKAHEQA